MSSTRFVVSVALFVPLAISCGESSSGGSRSNSPAVSLPADGGARPSGSTCEPVIVAAGDFGCRGDWTCSDAAALSLLCMKADAGLGCLCSQGDASTVFFTDSVCSSDGGVSQVARRFCGWDVP